MAHRSTTATTSVIRKPNGVNYRPFYTTVVLLSLLATYSYLDARFSAQHHHHHEKRDTFGLASQDCRLVHTAADKCAFVKRNCHDDEAGLIEYLTFYYCSLGDAQPLAFIIMVLWLGLLFTTIGIAASDFFSVNLSTIATFLGLSESLAGVTFLAFGNGSPDVFSTFAAMSSNSGSMAVGELIGAAGFITSVVAGSMALVREFKVSRKTFVRDICFFVAAVAFAMAFLADGELHLWECAVMIGFYIFYVIVVVGWHAYSTRRHARRQKEAAARGHFYRANSERANDELEPYRDEPDDEDADASMAQSSHTEDIGALERSPLIEIGMADQEPDGDSDHNQHVAAEMTSSMRVNRPRGRRSTTTITPIRPSLVGALEFRSVLSSLQREGNVPMRPIHTRSRSTDRLQINSNRVPRQSDSSLIVPNTEARADGARSRALSSGNVPIALDADLAAHALGPYTVGGRLAPPPMNGRSPELSSPRDSSNPNAAALLPRLQIPSPSGSEASSPAHSPFPQYTDSPMIMTPNASQTPYPNPLSPSQEASSPYSSLTGLGEPKPVRWWPYAYLPAPHLLLSTLFPTLQGWRAKSIWDKFLSLVSVPSIFLLVITLPVVESDSSEDNSEDGNGNEPSPSGPTSHTTIPVSVEPNGSIETETEWQRYRRTTRSSGSSRSSSPCPINQNTPRPDRGPADTLSVSVPEDAIAQPSKPVPGRGQEPMTLHEGEQEWNRWLLILQVFVGPLFCVVVFWANLAEDLQRPIMVLVRALLISLVCSLALLAFLLLTTSPSRRPKYHVAFCFLGFIIAIAWISTVAGEVVGVLKAFGVILDISEAILGLTIFAVGNSVGDLVADVTVARLGYPVMALSACFGGPLLNILLGVGLGGAYQTIHAANKHQMKHPDQPYRYKPYRIQVTGTLMVSAIALLVTLVALLVVVPVNKWVMSRKIGWGLITLWTASTIINLAIEITGVWGDIS